jgi:hypothetical protein
MTTVDITNEIDAIRDEPWLRDHKDIQTKHEWVDRLETVISSVTLWYGRHRAALRDTKGNSRESLVQLWESQQQMFELLKTLEESVRSLEAQDFEVSNAGDLRAIVMELGFYSPQVEQRLQLLRPLRDKDLLPRREFFDALQRRIDANRTEQD